MEVIKVSSIKNLKELSWYLIIPLLTSASVLQFINDAPSEQSNSFQYLFDWFLFVGLHFITITIVTIIFFFLYKFIAGYLEGILLFPLTIIVATTILSFATVGLMLHTLKPEGVYIPINIIWFLGFITLSFNLYQLEDN